jgi:hypothetical protein
MTSVTDVSLVRELLGEVEETDPDAFYELCYDAGFEYEPDEYNETVLPKGWTFKAVESKTDREYDSYGNSSIEDGYIIFELADNVGNSALYQMPISCQSYSGWDYSPTKVRRVEKQAKVVQVWEWVRA